MRASRPLRVASALKDQPRWLREYIKGPNFFSEQIMPTMAEASWDTSLFPLAEPSDIVPGAVLVREIKATPQGLRRPDGSVRMSKPFNHYCVVLDEERWRQEPNGYPGQLWQAVGLAYWRIDYHKLEAFSLVQSWVDMYYLGLPDLKPLDRPAKSVCRLLIPSPQII